MGTNHDSEDFDSEALVAALHRRDPAAMRTLYGRYSDRIFGFLFRLTRDRVVADDLHQETWLAVARHAVNLRVGSDLAAWLFTVARNKYRSWCRWTIVSDRLANGLDSQEHVTASSPRAGLREELRDLEQSLDRLAPPFREVLLLAGCEEMNSIQIASILGTTPAAVRQRLARARASLMRAMKLDDLAEVRLKMKGTQ